MKMLILSDLHISVQTVISQVKLDEYKNVLKKQINTDYDVVLISGDVFEHGVTKKVNVFETLYYLFEGKDVVFCLGNHEFAYEDYNSVLKTYNAQYDVFNGKYPEANIVCLDVSGKYDGGNYRVVGNAFWYDWSLNHCRALMKGEIIDGWLDATIENFDALKEHDVCKNQILSNIDVNKNMILLTHCVPHRDLNLFNVEQPFSPFNSYSGVDDFLNEIKDKNFKFVFCGHTHRRVNKEIYGINCLNIGNDYFFKTGKIEWMMLDVDDAGNVVDFQKSS